jgi:CheY-like chemotaxis protein
MLEKLGCRADIAGNGNEVLAALRRQPYDVVLMDCQMPELDGFATTRAIRSAEKADPARPRVHIIALTANAMRGDREACLACGMDAYISKPVKLDALAGALDHAGSLFQQNPPQAMPPNPQPPPPPPLNPGSCAIPADDELRSVSNALARMAQDFGADAAAELLGDYLRDAATRLRELHELRDNPDREAYARAAHSFAGASSIFGLEGLRRLGLAVEAAIRANTPDEAARIENELNGRFAWIEPRLREQLAGLQPVPTA